VLSSLGRFFHYLRWLGPWASGTRVPEGVTWRPVTTASDPHARSRLYLPTRKPVRGAWLISPGLHYDGPTDARMHRLAAILASAGNAVMSPAISELMSLRIAPAVTREVEDAFDALVQQPEVPKGASVSVISISVGSLAALQLAASPRYAPRVARVVCFGGYGEPVEFLRFLLGRPGAENGAALNDPLNKPVVFLTLLDHLPVVIRDREALCATWRRYVHQTWPRAELKLPGSLAHVPIAESLATSLCAEDAELFLIGCGALPGGRALADAALERAEGHYAFLDPTAGIEQLSAPVHLVHGTGDRVIPFSQLHALRAASPRARVYPLRTYEHSNAASPAELARRLPAAVADVMSLIRIVRAIV
jgi:pimeloyl-ACP methyl ester carboxylesterase